MISTKVVNNLSALPQIIHDIILIYKFVERQLAQTSIISRYIGITHTPKPYGHHILYIISSLLCRYSCCDIRINIVFPGTAGEPYPSLRSLFLFRTIRPLQLKFHPSNFFKRRKKSAINQTLHITTNVLVP